jgi:hypothetical protein
MAIALTRRLLDANPVREQGWRSARGLQRIGEKYGAARTPRASPGDHGRAWQQQQKDAKIGALSFDERFTLIVDAEHQARDNRRLTRLLKDAQLRIPEACVEDVAASPAPTTRN